MHQHAIEDGVRYQQNDISLPTFYYPLCCNCGEEVLCYSYHRGKQYSCERCKLEEKERLGNAREIVSNDLKNKRFKNALKAYRMTLLDGRDEYDFAFKRIKEHLYRDGWFQSTEEIIVAIEMVAKGLKVRHQASFGKFKADFVLTNDKIVLEVDGSVYHTRKTRDSETLRDYAILSSLGPEWEVVRMSDSFIRDNVGYLHTFATSKRRELQKIRASNGGDIPDRLIYKKYMDKKSFH